MKSFRGATIQFPNSAQRETLLIFLVLVAGHPAVILVHFLKANRAVPELEDATMKTYSEPTPSRL
jgi:hypothetical protein